MVLPDLLELALDENLTAVLERYSNEKLLWIKDSKEFWRVFNRERTKERRRLRSLSFRKKLEMMRVKTKRAV